jgi:UTP--glucose-1-phosphate uridylyltransferase
MIPVLDKPLVQYAVEEAYQTGIRRFVFVTGQGKGAIEDHFDAAPHLKSVLEERGNDAALGKLRDLDFTDCTIAYVRQTKPLGLGHAIWCARGLVRGPFAVLLADDLIQSSEPFLGRLIQAYEQHQGNWVGVMEVPHHDVSRYGILDVQTREVDHICAKGFVEKPAPCDAPSRIAAVGRYVLEPGVFDVLDDLVKHALAEPNASEIQVTQAIAQMLPETLLWGRFIEGRRFDCGVPAGMVEAFLYHAWEDPELGSYVRDKMTKMLKK